MLYHAHHLQHCMQPDGSILPLILWNYKIGSNQWCVNCIQPETGKASQDIIYTVCWAIVPICPHFKFLLLGEYTFDQLVTLTACDVQFPSLKHVAVSSVNSSSRWAVNWWNSLITTYWLITCWSHEENLMQSIKTAQRKELVWQWIQGSMRSNERNRWEEHRFAKMNYTNVTRSEVCIVTLVHAHLCSGNISNKYM